LIDGVVDIAIVGDNLLVEKERNSSNPKLGFSNGFCSCTKSIHNTTHKRWMGYE
jgi:ATP phosphoribosyltransferase